MVIHVVKNKGTSIGPSVYAIAGTFSTFTMIAFQIFKKMNICRRDRRRSKNTESENLPWFGQVPVKLSSH